MSTKYKDESWYAPGYAPTRNNSPAYTYGSNGTHYAPTMGGAGGSPSKVSSASYVVPGAEGYPTAASPQAGNTASGQGYMGGQGMILGGNMTHVSGYQGPVVYDARGRAYTDYGAYLREDGFYYPQGATISKNGQYYDIGNGWQFGKLAAARYPDGTLSKVTGGSVYGLAPGTRIDLMDDWSWGGASAGGQAMRTAVQGQGTDGQTGGNTDGTTADGGAAVIPTPEEIEAYLRLIEYSYNYFIQPAWEKETADRRGEF